MKIFKYRFWDSIHLFLSSLSFFPWLQFKTAFLLLDVIVINFVHSINPLRTVGVRALKIEQLKIRWLAALKQLKDILAALKQLKDILAALNQLKDSMAAITAFDIKVFFELLQKRN